MSTTVKPQLERVSNEPAIIPIILWPGGPQVFVRREDEADAQALMQGEREMVREEGEPFVRRILDLGAREGAFAVYSRLRWPYAWVDCLEGNELLRDLCLTNTPPGTRVFSKLDDLVAYDLVRSTVEYDPSPWAPHAKILFFDGYTPRPLPEPWVQVAGGMRAKHQPFSWWVRK